MSAAMVAALVSVAACGGAADPPAPDVAEEAIWAPAEQSTRPPAAPEGGHALAHAVAALPDGALAGGRDGVGEHGDAWLSAVGTDLQPRWTVRPSRGGRAATLAVAFDPAAGRALAGGDADDDACWLTAHDPATGVELERTELEACSVRAILVDPPTPAGDRDGRPWLDGAQLPDGTGVVESVVRYGEDVLLAGAHASGDGPVRAWVCRLAPSLSVRWCHHAESADLTSASGVVLAGGVVVVSAMSPGEPAPGALLGLTPDGEVVWRRTLDAQDEGLPVARDLAAADGRVWAGGHVVIGYGATGSYWLRAVDPRSGRPVAERIWDGPHRTESIADLAIDDAGRLWVAGWSGTGGRGAYLAWTASVPE